MKKRFVCYLVIVAMAFSLLMGCAGQQENPEPEEAITLSSYNDAKVGVCIYQLSDNFMSLFQEELISYLLSKGFSKNNIIVYGSANSENVQLSQVEKLVEYGVDALIINPVNSSVVHSITDMATAADIPLVYINREPSGDEEIRWETLGLNVTYVGGDARQSGIYQGEILADLGLEQLDKNGDGAVQYYMIEGAPENIDAGYRTMYSVSTIKNSGIEMECLLDEVSDWDRDKARLITLEGLVDDLIPEVVICNNDAMALGAIDALVDAGLKPGQDVYVVGVDALPEALTAIEDGTLAGTVFNDYIEQSHLAADAMMNYLQGDSNEHYIGCNYVMVNTVNVKAIEQKIKKSEDE